MKPWMMKLGLLAFSLSLVAIVLEIALRLAFGPPVHFRYPQERYVPEPVIGHWLEPDQRTYTHDRPVETNSIGLRGPERSQRLSPGQCRILGLGDSQTFGDGLEYSETWPFLLQSLLSSRVPESEIQVLNAGISGTDSWQHEHVLRKVGKHYDYDSVVLAFYLNDVTPRYTPRQATALTNTSTKQIVYALKRSALVTFLGQLYQMRVSSPDVVERERRILEDDWNDTLERAWIQVADSLQAMLEEVSSRNAELMLVVLPRRDQVSAEEPPRGYNRRIREIAGQLGIPLIDVLPDLRRAYAVHGEALFIPWNGHNTRITNEIVAGRIVEAFGVGLLCAGQALRAEVSGPVEPHPAR